MDKIKKKSFNCFNVYSSEDDHSVIHVDITSSCIIDSASNPDLTTFKKVFLVRNTIC